MTEDNVTQFIFDKNEIIAQMWQNWKYAFTIIKRN